MPTKQRRTALFAAAAIIIGLFALQAPVMAQEKAEAAKKPVSKKLVQAISEKFIKARADLVVDKVELTEVEGVYRATFGGNKGAVYVVGDGDFFFVGDLYQIQETGLVNVTEEAQNGPRAKLMASVSRDDMIIFSPKGKVKASVAVFTDVDCGYCQKLHAEVGKMNELGIEIRYLAYPRAGVGSNSFKKIASAWCAEDPQDALTKLKARQEIPMNVCEGNPVADQFSLGAQVGLSGTPAIILDSGKLIPGYMPADQLAKTLGI